MVRIMFVGEGVTDVGDVRCPSTMAVSDREQHESAPPQQSPRGVIPILVLRSLKQGCKQSTLSFERHARHFARLHARGFARKVKAAMVDARRQGVQALAIVVDRGGQKNANRLQEMELGRQQANADNVTIPTALGLAIEELEAWLLCDEKAIAAALGTTITELNPAPEGIKHPKRELDRLCAPVRSDAVLESIAAKTSLDLLAKRCPRGFVPFRDEVLDAVAPLFVERPS